MTYSEEQLVAIEKYASVFMSITDIAAIMRLPAERLRFDIAQRDSDVSVRYHRAKAATKVALHVQDITLAKLGSPLALDSAREHLLDMEDDE